MGGGLLQELDHLLVIEVVGEVELKGVVDGGHVWGVDGDGEEVPPFARPASPRPCQQSLPRPP